MLRVAKTAGERSTILRMTATLSAVHGSRFSVQESGGLVVGWTWLAILGGLIGKGLELIVIFTLNKGFFSKNSFECHS